jgi:DNA-binding NarL/FixJ family response regulator
MVKMSPELVNPPTSSFKDWSVSAKTAESNKIRVLVADSNRMASELLANALGDSEQIQVVAAVSSTVEIAQAVVDLRPEVVLLSAVLEGRNGQGLELAGELLANKPEISVVILLESSSSDAVVSAFRSGASGVFSREGSLQSLSKCIRSVYEGHVWASSEEIRFVLEALSTRPQIGVDRNKFSMLTRREREVANLATAGQTNKEIANRLEISEHTVKNYMFSIFEKLGVNSRVELTLGASPSNVVSLPISANEASIQWIRELAEEGLASAQFLLGEIYHLGRYVPQNRVEAYQWYLLAQQCDLSQAGDMVRKKLAKEMSPLQVAEAEQRVITWLNRKKKAARQA